MSISTADAAKLRAKTHTLSLVLNAMPLVAVATAQVDQSTFAYPLASIDVDNQSESWATEVIQGRAFSIGSSAGGSDITWGIVRKAPSGDTFYIDPKSLGDPGYARAIMGGLQDDYYVTVYAHFPLWSEFSFIKNKRFYKRWDVAYTDQGSNPPPVCNIGGHQQAFVDPVEGTATLNFSAAGSFAWGSKTLSSYAWSIITVDGGDATIDDDTAQATDMTFEAGYYIVACTLTDSASKTHTAYRYVFINDTGDYKPFGALHPYQIGSDTQDRSGRRLELNLTDQFAANAVYPGQFFHLKETALFNGSALETESHRVSAFVGYAPEARVTRSISTPSVSVTLENPYLYSKRIAAVSQGLVEKTSPARWTECTSVLSNPVGAAWYILAHHVPNLLRMHDYLPDTSLKSLRKQAFGFQANSTIGAQLDTLQNLALGTIGNRSDGALVFVPNGVYLDNDSRNALDNRFVWGVGDILPDLEYPYTFHAPVTYVNAYGTSYTGGSNATPFQSLAPGKVQGQGSATADITCIVSGQDRLNEVSGHHYAKEMFPVPAFRTRVNRNMDICEPVDSNVWHYFNVSSLYDPLAIGWDNKRVLPVRVTRNWSTNDLGALLKRITVDWQLGTFGQPGVTIPVPRGGGNVYTPVVQTPVDYDQKLESAFGVAWNDGGKLGVSVNLNSDYPHWTSLTDNLLGSVNDWTPDYASDFFIEGVGAMGCWCVTTSGTTLRIYYFDDIRTRISTPVLQASYTMADSTVTTSARIQASKADPNFVVAAWRCRTGTRVVRTTDGSTWGSAITVGDTTSDTGSDNAELGFAVDGMKQLVTARDTDGAYYLYLAITTGGSFSKVTDSPASSKPYPVVSVDGQGSAYCRTIEASLADIEVTFDTGGWTDYTFTGSTTVQSGGNPGNCARNTANIISMCVNLGGTHSIRRIELDCYVTWTGTPSGGENRRVFINGRPGSGCSSGSTEFDTNIDVPFTSIDEGVWETIVYEPTTPNATGSILFQLDRIGSGTASLDDRRLDNVRIYFE